MREDTKPFPTCTLKGSWHEMGVQYGKDMKPEIAEMLEWWKGIYLSMDPKCDINIIIDHGYEKYAAAAEKFSPRVVEFMKGTAEGAGLEYRQILFANAASNLIGGSTDAGAGVQGCTSFALDPKRTSTGKMVIGQNLDWHTEMKVVVLRMEPDDSPRGLVVTYAGLTPQFGFSEAGYGMQVNALLWPTFKDGAIMYSMCTEALFQDSLEGAMEVITGADRAMAFNFLFAYKDGSMLDIETTPEDFGPLMKENGVLLHTNHYLTERFKEKDLYKVEPDTFIRYSQAKEKFNDKDKLSIEDIKAILRSHDGGDRTCSICCHPDPGAKDYTEAYASVVSVISIPEDGKMYLTEFPCENEFVEYQL